MLLSNVMACFTKFSAQLSQIFVRSCKLIFLPSACPSTWTKEHRYQSQSLPCIKVALLSVAHRT